MIVFILVRNGTCLGFRERERVGWNDRVFLFRISFFVICIIKIWLRSMRFFFEVIYVLIKLIF